MYKKSLISKSEDYTLQRNRPTVIRKILKKATIFAFAFTLIFSTFTINASAASRTTVYSKGEWKVYLDSPDNAKPYYHLHLYKKSKHVYCLRLDNMQPCDGTRQNENKVPKSVKQTVMKHANVKKAVIYHKPVINNQWVKNILKPLLIAGASIGVVLAAVNIFTGPIDDVAAWAALTAAMNM
ncbi:hypothetical protein MKC74_06685 [[Clostridium] innocuum]|nr:hypothetical protein [[Clostridium] innocuum]